MEPFDFSQGRDARTLITQPLTLEEISQREAGYRSGYRDAWLVCIETFASALPPEASMQGWDFWATELRAWLFDRPEQRVTPPDLMYQPDGTGKQDM